ncbi:MAG: adenine phosphoribosyltransferase [Verrucomicrobiales bacterium]|nr:adenine phosphoribosyltransferase [Verrucomicrobiales bacterium]
MQLEKPPLADLQQAIRNVPDFPRPGIQFKDVTPVLADPRLFAGAVAWLMEPHAVGSIDAVAGIEARGFLFAAAVALQLGAGVVPVRKAGKLPWKTYEASYDLEYGSNTLAVHTDAVAPGARVLLIDDLLATGGTAQAAASLLGRLGARVVEVAFVVELAFLKGRDRLPEYPVRSLLTY